MARISPPAQNAFSQLDRTNTALIEASLFHFDSCSRNCRNMASFSAFNAFGRFKVIMPRLFFTSNRMSLFIKISLTLLLVSTSITASYTHVVVILTHHLHFHIPQFYLDALLQPDVPKKPLRIKDRKSTRLNSSHSQ